MEYGMLSKDESQSPISGAVFRLDALNNYELKEVISTSQSPISGAVFRRSVCFPIKINEVLYESLNPLSAGQFSDCFP